MSFSPGPAVIYSTYAVASNFRRNGLSKLLDEDTYGVGDPNSLMTPVMDGGEAIHDPGPITRAVFADMGWAAPAPQAAQPVYLPLVARQRGSATASAATPGHWVDPTGALYASGSFGSATTASGTAGLDHLGVSGCGTISGGP